MTTEATTEPATEPTELRRLAGEGRGVDEASVRGAATGTATGTATSAVAATPPEPPAWEPLPAPTASDRARAVVKRLFDLGASLVGLVVLSPVFVVAAVAIRLDSAGPAFYTQERIGRNGRVFRIVKFRSMRNGTDRDANHVTVSGDPRITRVGAFLRKHKIDEFPQLFNVVRGEMSLVGPRPEVASFVALYDERQRQVLNVRPGITSTASIAFRNENELLSEAQDPEAMYLHEIMPKKLDMNLAYLELRPGLWSDVRVILETLSSVYR